MKDPNNTLLGIIATFIYDLDNRDACYLLDCLGIKLFRESRDSWMNAPSIDRIDNSIGYIPENIVIISRRANILKKDATIDELIKLADFYKTYLR